MAIPIGESFRLSCLMFALLGEDPYSAHVVQIWASKGGYLLLSCLICSILEDLDQLPIFFYRPKSIDDIVAKTKFTKREVQLIYRSFKQV